MVACPSPPGSPVYEGPRTYSALMDRIVGLAVELRTARLREDFLNATVNLLLRRLASSDPDCE